MADDRFADDTIFIIFEGDYCLLESDEQARQEWEAAQDKIGLELRATYELAAALPEDKRKEFQNRYLRWNAKDVDVFGKQAYQETPFPEKLPHDEIAKPKAFPKFPPKPPNARKTTGDEKIEIDGPPQKDAQSVSCDHSKFLLDVLDIAAIAGRRGCGDFVWLAWDASHWTGGAEEKKSWKVRQESPTSGAHLSIMTAKGARFLMQQMKAGKLPKGHMGHQFIFWLKHFQGLSSRPNPHFGASYIVPPLGGYMSHDTTWMKLGKQARLDSHWNAKWMQEGSRTEDLKGRSKVRKLVHYREKGHCETLCEVHLPLEEHQWWTTEAPEGLPNKFCGVQEWHRPRVVEDCMRIIGCLSSAARDEPVAVHFSCCIHQYEFEVDRSLIAEPSTKSKQIMRTIVLPGRSSASQRKLRNASRSLATF